MSTRRLVYPVVLFCILFSTLCAREYLPEEKLSQMFVLGFQGSSIQEAQAFVSGNTWGGYILYSRDYAGTTINLTSIAQTKTLLQELKGDNKDTRIKPFLATDMEGGQMQLARSTKDSFDFFNSPGFMARTSVNAQERWATGIATQLKDLGFNLNLAPVVDISSASDRFFANSANSVIADSRLFMKQHQTVGVLCTLKHFPGRSSGWQEDINTHYDKEVDLKPFQELCNEPNVGLIMISTQMFPVLDPFKPAHLSEPIHAKLRSMGYAKLIITDDVSAMLSKNITVEQLQANVIELINAGNDLILFANRDANYDPQLSIKLRKVVRNIIAQRLISERRIEESFQRILSIKQECGIEPKEIYLNYGL